MAAHLAGGKLELPPNGFIYLEEEGAVNFAPSKVTALA